MFVFFFDWNLLIGILNRAYNKLPLQSRNYLSCVYWSVKIRLYCSIKEASKAVRLVGSRKKKENDEKFINMYDFRPCSGSGLWRLSIRFEVWISLCWLRYRMMLTGRWKFLTRTKLLFSNNYWPGWSGKQISGR